MTDNSREQVNSHQQIEKRTAFFAGIDLGTSGCRLTVIDQYKKMHSQTTIAYKNPDKQTPQLWWDSVAELLKNLPAKIKQNLKSIAVDGTSGTLLLVDAQGKPTSSVLMYNDLRATAEAEIIKKVMPENNGGQGASGSLARLIWLLKHESSSPESAKGKHAHAVHQADYILGKLANDFSLSDENNCLKLGYDVVNQQWLDTQLEQLGIDKKLLPQVFPVGRSVATLDNTQAVQLGLSSTLQLVTGTTDSIGAFIATGADKVGDAVTSLGSTLVLKLISDNPIFSPQHGIYSHRFGDRWLVGGASNSGARVLQRFFSQQQLDELTPQLAPNKITGLDYYPLIKIGERFPVADANKQPKLLPRPTSDVVFFQGLIEGIARIEKQGYNKLQELGAPKVSSLRSVGGGAKNKAWTQIRKNQLQLEMIEPEQTEAAYGSALLAQRGWETRVQPVIETERLVLRPFVSEDASTVQQLAGNYNVAKTTLNIPHPYEDGMAEAWITTHKPAWISDGLARYAIISKLTGDLMGVVGLVDIKEDTASLGYWLGEAYWNKGYCTEATKAFLDFCFKTLKLKKIEAEYLVTNPASGRVMEKAGMVFTGTREIKHRDGSNVLLNRYEICYKIC